MKTTEQTTTSACILKPGLCAALRGLLISKGTGAPTVGLGCSATASASLLAALATTVAALLVSAGLTAALPAAASAYAAIEAPPVYSSAPGLPDNRVYEQVSPANKSGNQAGAGTQGNHELPGFKHTGVAAADGNSVLFEATGPIGETASPLTDFFVASKNESALGWSTRSVTPAPQQTLAETGGEVRAPPVYADPSADLSHALVVTQTYTLAALPSKTCDSQLFLTGPDPFVAALWLERPEIANPVETCEAEDGDNGTPVGGTPNFSTVYFTYSSELLPEDATRKGGWGFYESSEGALREAGVLPDGSLNPYGAVPAASGHARAVSGNQVADEGKRAFFVSPDPTSGSSEPPELYVRENGARTLLVSRDTLLPEAGGLPAPAPGGAFQMPNPTINIGSAVRESDGSYVFASPDGSQAFFQSTDALTKSAEEAGLGMEPKTYDFNVTTGALTYLPDVRGEIVATDTDGSALAFVRPEAGATPAQLDLWSAGPDGGTVTPVTQLPGAGGAVSEARMSSEGSVVVFTTASSLAAAFNSGGAAQIYRYDAPANTLGCVSCPPHGVTPAGSAVISQLRTYEEVWKDPPLDVDDRGISAGGSRVFFDTPDPLVSQDTNTNSPPQPIEGEEEPQGRDVYEWENGVVYLISGGKSARNSYFLDNSANGNDVFFATSEGLVPGDTDNGYDVYDARVPQPGDSPPPAAVPCEGPVCQGPPHVPSALTPPASVTFSGLGNATPGPAVTPAVPTNTTTRTVRCKKGFTKKKNKCVKKKQAKKARNNRRAGR